MKYFTLATALLATAACALPTAINTPVTSSGLSGVSGEVNEVLTITTAEGKELVVELNKDAKGLLSGVDLSRNVKSSVGQIVQVADSVTGLHVGGMAGSTITVALNDGKYALVELTSGVEGLLAKLGLTEVDEIVGTVVSSLDGITSLARRDGLGSTVDGTLSVVSQTGETLVFQAVPSLLQGLDLSTIEGTVGKVIATVPAVGDLASEAEKLGEDPANLFGLLSADGTSALLVKVESTLTGLTSVVAGLLSSLGLSSLSTTVGTVVTGATATVGGTVSNL
ncbi:hypothetical protein N7468_009443 [Penicillium chermesinum]|uniref:Uncharacterized protein n=1 Tax=Penicillium chermesinum TaxID=63820 RepID=A0A9W9NK92_9EURO|nr:uncharacterized protein N7468_009443 [Penicillium chermesinum]KAJ5220239.1 hypothetical protein N7468_009443 [Penicillium chermesinum]